MPRRLEQGEVALYKYNQLRFSFLDGGAVEPLLLTSDPWAFLNSDLQQKCKNVRGDNRQRAERALYFAGLAEDFYRAAEVVPLPAKGTLYYYGMLDLAKCLLSITGTQLETVPEHHGLTLSAGRALTVEVKTARRDAVNIFAAFSTALGKPVAATKSVDLRSAISHVPEVHGIYAALSRDTKPKLLPVDIEFQVNRKRDMLFTEIVYDKRQEYKVDATRFLKGKRAAYFREGAPRPGQVVWRAARRKRFTKDNMDRIYRNILSEYRGLDIVPILTASGYKYYVDLRPGDFPHLANSLLAMFYLGSAARYRPLEIKGLLGGELRPLISEFVALTPQQYLYQLVSIVTDRECVVPFARL